MPKGIKNSSKILILIATSIAIILAAVPILLQNSKIQNYIAKAITKELSIRFNSKVSVGTIEYKLFNTISLNDLYIEDLEKDTLLNVSQLNANFDFWKLFKAKIIFSGLEINKLHGNLKVDTAGKTNLDFIIKAFEKPQNNDSSNIEYQIRKLSLINSYLSYSKQNGLKTRADNIINFDSLRLHDINAEISLNTFTNDTLSANIVSLSFREKSGLVLKNLSSVINGSKRGTNIDFIKIELPHSKISLTNIELKYDSLTDFKNFSQKVKWNAPIDNSVIDLADFAAFVPELKNLKEKVDLKGLISGRISNLGFKKMILTYGKSLSLNADLELSGLPNLQETFIYGQINELKADKSVIQDIASGLSKKPVILPKELNQLGKIKYTGNITGFFSNLVAYGNLNTQLGSISTDILLKLENQLMDLKYNGTIKSTNFQLSRLLSEKKLGKVAFNVNTNGVKKHNTPIYGTIKAKFDEIVFNNYDYKDVKFDGRYDGSGFDGEINLSDNNIKANFKGVIDLTQKLPILDFKLRVDNTNLHALHLIDNYPNALLSFSGRTNMVGNSLDNINGYAVFDSITLNNANKTLNVDQIKFTSRIENNYTNFIVNSDFVNGSFKGNFKYSTIGKTINKIIRYYLPSLAVEINPNQIVENHIDVDLKFENTAVISDVLDLPYQLSGITILKGIIDEKTNKINLSANVPLLKVKTIHLENLTFDIENIQKELRLTTRAHMSENKEDLRLYLIASAAKDSVSTQLGWQNAEKVTNAGVIKTITKLSNEAGKMKAQMIIQPTQVILSDSIWNIGEAKIDLNSDSTIDIHNFRFEKKAQYVQINGKASKNISDSITLSMNDLDVEYILKLVRLTGITISGHASGNASLVRVLSKPIFLANLKVKDLGLNHTILGNAKVKSTWDKENKQLLLAADIFKQNNDTLVIAKGVFVPRLDSLDLNFDARGLNIHFLDQYFAGVANNVQGEGYGKVRLFGPMKKLGFEGNVFVDRGQATIEMLKTTYFFNDTIKLQRHTLTAHNLRLYDEERNKGTLNGIMHHSGLFDHMTYNATITAKDMLAMNTHSKDNDYFYGKAYATGTVNIYGDQHEANIIIKAVSQPKTKCYIQMGGTASASNNNFINFESPNQRENIVETKKVTANNFNVKVDMQIDVTPDAQMELIVDPKAGDVISGKGNGSLRIQFDSFSPLKLYGTYIIDVGSYLFTLQTVIRKEFKIDQGSTISFTGSPFDAQVNIRALYSLTASLSDLLDDASTTTNRGSVPVNCVLNLTEDLMKPTIRFEIELPASDESRRQIVKSIINTEEMVNRQIAYLLVLGKFYTPDNSNNNPNAGLNNFTSFAFSTLSSHLNNWIQKSLNNNNLSFGLDWQKSELQTDEIKAQLNYQNKRVILNGEFGYRNDNLNTSTNASKFIGDFDLEYLLTESGKIRGKVYSHSIDRAQLKEAKTTQGLGVVYKEDFNSVGEMFKYYWEFLTGKNKTKKDKTNAENTN